MERSPRLYPTSNTQEYWCRIYCYLSYFFYMLYSLVIWTCSFTVMFSIVSLAITSDALNLRKYYYDLVNKVDTYHSDHGQTGEEIVMEYDRIQKKAQPM